MKKLLSFIFVFSCLFRSHAETIPTEPFELILKTAKDGGKTIHIKLDDGTKVLIDRQEAPDEPGSCFGAMPNSIQVYKLEGEPSLLHIEWRDYIQGNGGYQNLFYMICREDTPTQPLLKGSIPISGRWGWGTGHSGSYTVQYRNNNLCVRENVDFRDNLRTPRPLYHRVKVKGRDDTFMCVISTILTRTFSVTDRELNLKSTFLEYKVQDGDTLDDICKGLKVKPEWILNTPFLSKNISTLQIELPKKVSKKRYPLIEEKAP